MTIKIIPLTVNNSHFRALPNQKVKFGNCQNIQNNDEFLMADLDKAGNINKAFLIQSDNINLSGSLPVRKSDLNLYIRCPEEEILFYKKGFSAIPNIHTNSLFSMFSKVPILSDDEAAERLKQVTEYVVNAANKHYKNLGLSNKASLLGHVHTTLYDMLRAANYTSEETVGSCNKEYENIVSVHDNKMVVFIRNSWMWHIPKFYPEDKRSKCRISLNAQINETFIKNLDNYIIKNHINAKYKMPNSLYGANLRSDTFNIYFQEELTDKIKQDICKLAKPYIRPENQTLPVGQEISDGIFYSKEAHENDVQDLVKILYAINPSLAKQITRSSFYIKYSAKSLSAGQIEAAKIMLKLLIN